MSKELYFTDGNNEVKYLDTTASFNLAITQDGSAFDLTNATAIDVKVANDTGYVFTKSIDMATIKQPLAGLITMPVDAEVMNALVPDDYTIEVWVTLSSLITPGSQEGLTDTSSDGATTTATTPTTTATTPMTNTATSTTTYNAIFPSDDPQGFTITENVMSDSGDVIPVMSLDEFQQEFDQLKTDLTNQVSTLQGPKGDTGQGLEIKGKVGTTSQLPATASEGDGYLVNEELYVWTNGAWKDCGSIQGPQGIQGKTGTGVSSTTIQYQISNSATTAPTGTWSNTLIATTQVNPFLWTQVTLNYDDGTSKSFYLVSSKGDKGDKGDKGETGLVGPPGPVGAGLVVKGTVSNASQLPTTGNQEGYCYFVGTDLYVFDAGAWKNCGNVSPDLSNYVTVTDLNNGLSTKVTDNKNGSIQINGNTITPADDSKVVHDNHDNTITANNLRYDLSKTGLTSLCLVNSGSFNDLPLGTVFANATKMTDGPDTFYGFTTTTFYTSCWNSRKAQIAIADNANLMYFRVGAPNDIGKLLWNSWTLLSDDTKVAHLSGANNFDTVPTVNNNPLLLASSLPSDLARTGQDQEFTGKNTFDVAPIDKTTGNPYITKDGVPAVPSTLADTTKLSNFTAGLQSNGTAVATQTDVTTAISTATDNMVDSTKATNFTSGLQSGGVDVATAADLKSIEDSAWRVLDNKYISTKPTSNTTISSDTTILYKLDTDNKRIYLQGTILVSSNATGNLSTSVSIDFSNIAKTISFASGYYALQYWGNSPSNSQSSDSVYSSSILNDKLVMSSTTFGVISISNLSSSSQPSTVAYVIYDELV